MTHELAQIAGRLGGEIGPLYSDKRQPRFVIGLLLLKQICERSDVRMR